jgi:hypothetical protein
MAARIYEVTYVRDFKRPYKIIHLGGFLRWIVQHEGASRHGLGRKNARRGWKQHFAKFPQRGYTQTALILLARRDANKKARLEKAK